MASHTRRTLGFPASAAVGVATLSFVTMALAGSSVLKDPATESVPFPMSRDAVLKGVPLKIGDLSVASSTDVQLVPLRALDDPDLVSSCLEIGSKWIHSSDDRKGLEFNSAPWGTVGVDHLQTAYCASGDIIIGGYAQSDKDAGSQRQAWIFSRVAGQSSPTKVLFGQPFAVGEWPKQTPYSLEEVRFIDAASKRILFLGTSDVGERSVLSAPFAIVESGRNAD